MIDLAHYKNVVGTVDDPDVLSIELQDLIGDVEDLLAEIKDVHIESHEDAYVIQEFADDILGGHSV